MDNSPSANAPIVLVVDDEALLRSNAADFLEEAGFKTLEAADAAEALRIMERGANVGILFTDVRMPGSMDGIELAERIHDKWPEVLLLIASGNDWPPMRSVPDHGHFLPKPYRIQNVIDEIRALELEAAVRRKH